MQRDDRHERGISAATLVSYYVYSALRDMQMSGNFAAHTFIDLLNEIVAHIRPLSKLHSVATSINADVSRCMPPNVQMKQLILA